MNTNVIATSITILFFTNEILLLYINKKHKLIRIFLYVIEFLIFFKVSFDSSPFDLKEMIAQTRGEDLEYKSIVYLMVVVFCLSSVFAILINRKIRNWYQPKLKNYILKLLYILTKNYKTISGKIIEVGLQEKPGDPITIIIKNNENNEEKNLLIPAHLIDLAKFEEKVTIDYLENKNEVWSIRKNNS